MITTGCEGCCFLKQDDKGKGCSMGQMCTSKNGQVFTPGYCRTCRSHKWAEKQKETDLQRLYGKVLNERKLKLDMLIFFDESHNKIEDLEHTLNSDWYIKYAQKIIIMDTTGFGDRQNLALQYIKSREHSVPTMVDSSVAHEPIDLREETIRRLSKQVTAPFFLVISAGKEPMNFDSFATMIKDLPSRVIHWSFPSVVGLTVIVPNINCGLFITKPYRLLMKSPEIKSFTEQLRKEEIETGMGLSWFCQDSLLI